MNWLVAPCAALSIVLLPAAALGIPCNTGVAGTCAATLLASGTVDPNWTVAYAAPSGVPIAAPPTLFGAAFANSNAAWLAKGPFSGWITPSPIPNHAESGGQYVYHTVFDGIAPFVGRYTSDNELIEVFLNGLLINGFPLNGPADANIWTGFSISSGLVAFGNTLDFVVRNRGALGVDSNPTITGFRAEIPEPAMVLLCLVASGGMLLSRRYARRKANSGYRSNG